MRAVAVLVATLLTAACGVPQELSKQAEEVQSVAAEGALLAHGAAEGSATDPYVEEHAQALRKVLEELRAAIEDDRLAEVAAEVSTRLEELADAPGDRSRAGLVETELEGAAQAAEELAG